MTEDLHPILFVHVMKTGGTTLFRHLRSRFAPEEIYPSRQLDRGDDGVVAADMGAHVEQLSLSRLAAIGPEERQRIRVFAGHFPFVAAEVIGEPLFTITIVRDPVERTISLLRQRARDLTWVRGGSRTSGVGVPLEEIYERPLVFECLVRDHQTKVFSMERSDQTETIMDGIAIDGARLALAKQNLERVDLLGVTERYGAFLDEVEGRLGWRVPRGARANRTPVASRKPVSESLRRRIAEDSAFDVELYEHALKLLGLRRRGRSAG